MRRGVLAIATSVLLACPAVLAFRAGGYFDGARLPAAIVLWCVVLLVAVASRRPLPTSSAGRTALGGLLLLTVWSAISLAWAPVAGPAIDDITRLLLYVAAFIAGAALLRGRAATLAEPALAATAVVAIGYGLAGRLLPGLVHQAHSLRAGARLEQPLTYWNAEGALGAMGLVLCAHLAGDWTRRPWVRIVAAAACPVLGAGVSLSYSRGAVAAAVTGLVVLVALAPSWPQLRAAGAALTAGLLAAGAAALFPTVAQLSGSVEARERDGAIVLGLLILVALGAAALIAWCVRGERRERRRLGLLSGARAVRWAAVAALGLALVGLVTGGLAERGNGTTASDAQDARRLTTLQSNRYDYWRVAVDAFRDEPLRGVGSGGFRVAWYRESRVTESVRDAHSLEAQTAAELGLPGLLGLALFLGGVAAATRRAARRHPAMAAGWGAACVVWLLHATIDWDWQMPAVTLPALLLAGALVAAAEPARAPAPPRRGQTGGPASKPSPRTAPVAREFSAP